MWLHPLQQLSLLLLWLLVLHPYQLSLLVHQGLQQQRGHRKGRALTCLHTAVVS
jgi:hypothetical protein